MGILNLFLLDDTLKTLLEICISGIEAPLSNISNNPHSDQKQRKLV